MDPKNIPSWNGRKIVKEEDKHDLENRAAVYEFKHRMKRDDAEHRAHHEYKKDKHREAAAHHLAGMKAASAAGSHDEARKHALMYQMHLDALHHDPIGPVPQDISSLVEKQDRFYKFKAHGGDSFLLQAKPEEPEDEKHDPLDEASSKDELSKAELAKGNLVQFPREKIGEARDLGQPAKVIPMQTQPECHECINNAHKVLHVTGNLDQAIGPNSAKLFLQKHPHANNPESMAHAPEAKRLESTRSLAVLMHARHSFARKDEAAPEMSKYDGPAPG